MQAPSRATLHRLPRAAQGARALLAAAALAASPCGAQPAASGVAEQAKTPALAASADGRPKLEFRCDNPVCRNLTDSTVGGAASQGRIPNIQFRIEGLRFGPGGVALTAWSRANLADPGLKREVASLRASAPLTFSVAADPGLPAAEAQHQVEGRIQSLRTTLAELGYKASSLRFTAR